MITAALGINYVSIKFLRLSIFPEILGGSSLSSNGYCYLTAIKKKLILKAWQQKLTLFDQESNNGFIGRMRWPKANFWSVFG